VLTGEIRLWQVVVLAALFGLFSAVDNPARQAFVQEMARYDLGLGACLAGQANPERRYWIPMPMTRTPIRRRITTSGMRDCSRAPV
jgi:hypothetical protein